MYKVYLYLFICSIIIAIILIPVILNENQNEKKRKNDYKKKIEEENQLELDIQKQIIINKAFKENQICINNINKKNLIKEFDYNINSKIKKNNKIPLNEVIMLSIKDQNLLLSQSKISIQDKFLKCKYLKKEDVNEKIIIPTIDRNTFPIIAGYPHFYLVSEIIKKNPFQVAKILRRNIEDIQHELIYELIKFKYINDTKFIMNEEKLYIYSILTNENRDLIVNSKIKFNGNTVINDVIFSHEKGIVILNFVSFPLDNKVDYINKRKKDKLLTEKYIDSLFKNKIPINNIYIVCNKNSQFKIKDVGDYGFIINPLDFKESLEKVHSTEIFSKNERQLIMKLLKEKINSIEKETFVNMEPRINSLIEVLDNLIDEYFYIYKYLIKYKDIFELTQPMELYYLKETDTYLLKKREK